MKAEFLRFVAVGAFAALMNWLSRIGLSTFLPLSAAIVIAYLIGMTIAYTLSRAFVFRSTSRRVAGEAARFAAVNVLALIQVWIVTMGLAVWVFPRLGVTWHPAELAHAIGVASPILTSYFGHKYFSFAATRRGNGDG